MMDAMLERLATMMRRETRQRPVKAPAHTREAGRQAAAIATRVFSRYPDMPLHRAIGFARPGEDMLRIGHASDPFEKLARVDVSDDHLFEAAARSVEKIAEGIMLREMRDRAVRQHGGNPDHPPAWTIIATPLFVDMLERMNIRPSWDAEREMGRRIDRAMRLYGGRSTMDPVDIDARVMLGNASTPWEPDGRPGLHVELEVNRAQRLTITNAPQLPETAMVQIVGRPLRDVVDVGPLSGDMTISDAERTSQGLRLTLKGDLITLAPVPDGVDTRWLEIQGASPRRA